jgi:TonB family protein
MICPLLLGLVVTHAAIPFAPQSGASLQPPAVTAPARVEQPWPPAGVVRLGAGIKAPVVMKENKPRYTSEARRAGIQGGVVMEAVVQTDGTVGDVRVTRSLDREFGLDDEAVRAVKTWLFKPGLKDGVAVPVLVEIEMTYTLLRR